MVVAYQWVEDVKPRLVVIRSDSYSAILSLASGVKTSRQDIIYEILASLFRISNVSLITFMRDPAHVGVEANEVVDKLAKQALNHKEKLGVRCLAQGSHLSCGQFLPERE